MPRTSKGSLTDPRLYAFKLLSYRSRSTKEMRERLHTRGFPAAAVEDTILYLKDLGYLNDETLAAELLKYATETRLLGEKGIRDFMARRGIERKYIDQVLQSRSAEADEASAAAFADKKRSSMRNCSMPVARRRLWAMLKRRGFSYEIIRKTVNSAVGGTTD